MLVLPATTEDHHSLTQLTIQSKAHWGYSNELMNEWTPLLTVSKDYIRQNEVFKLVDDSKIIGYYSYSIEGSGTINLDNLFVAPSFIGKGFGKHLMLDFMERITPLSPVKVQLESDPNSEPFYTSFGFETIKKTESSIKNRFIPTMIKNC